MWSSRMMDRMYRHSGCAVWLQRSQNLMEEGRGGGVRCCVRNKRGAWWVDYTIFLGLGSNINRNHPNPNPQTSRHSFSPP